MFFFEKIIFTYSLQHITKSVYTSEVVTVSKLLNILSLYEKKILTPSLQQYTKNSLYY